LKTADLIELLGQEARVTVPAAISRTLVIALAVGGFVTLAAVALWLRCQPLLHAAGQPWFWMKAAYTGPLTLTGTVIVSRLAVPGTPLRAAPLASLLIVLVMFALAAGEIVSAAPATRLHAWLGETWWVCSPLILLLSIPIYGCLILALRTLAPTRLARTGAAAGFTAGALAATLYELHCPEQTAAFAATWYTVGIAAATALGAVTGERLLRW
jgi:hypothetical protein